MKLKDIFGHEKPLIGMIHLKGKNDEDVFNRALKEIEIYESSGISGIIVENYFGNYYQMEKVLNYLKVNKPYLVYGVNCLNFDMLGFELADKYNAKFVQFDSVVGHIKPRDEYSMQAFLDIYKNRVKCYILGGVRFKYQPVLSEKTLEEDLEISKKRCNAVVVTGEGTGIETEDEKIKKFKEILSDFPLIIGAGITLENAKDKLKYADGAIVGSYFKDTYKDDGELSKEHVLELVKKFKEIREGNND